MSTTNRSQKHGSTALKTSDANTAITAPKPTEIHNLLSSERRQIVIKHLVENESCELRELAEAVASEIEGHEVTSTDDEYDRYRVSLYQTHLDALADANVVAFERKSGTIRLGENASEVIDYMPEIESESRGFVDQLASFF